MTATVPQEPWKPRFFAIWIPQQLSLLGSAIAQFALVWWVTDTTGSATVLGTASLVAMLPQIVSGPIIGALVDRWNRRHIMMAADTLVALAAAWIAFLFWQDALRIWHIYVLMFVRSLGGSFHFPAMQASTSMMVPKRHLARISGLNQTLGGAVNVIGPPIGALLFSILPLHWLMGIDVITAFLAVVPLIFMAIPQPGRDEAGLKKPRSIWHDMWEGMRYVWHWRGMVDIITLAMLANLFTTPAFVLIPILVTRHYGGGAIQLGWLESSWGLGIVTGGLILGTWGGFKRRVVGVLAGNVGVGIGFLAVGLSSPNAMHVGMLGLFFGAIMNALCNGSAYAMLQERIPHEMQGRLFSLVMSLASLMNPLGTAVAGPVADLVDIRYVYLVGAAAEILIGTAGFFRPAIMQLEAQSPPDRIHSSSANSS